MPGGRFTSDFTDARLEQDLERKKRAERALQVLFFYSVDWLGFTEKF